MARKRAHPFFGGQMRLKVAAAKQPRPNQQTPTTLTMTTSILKLQ
jgi:hypothetical protein